MSNAIDDGGPAFPCAERRFPDGELNEYPEPGMTLLDYFAAKAMQSLILTNSEHSQTRGELAINAWVIADTMIEAKAAFLAAKAELLASKSAP